MKKVNLVPSIVSGLKKRGAKNIALFGSYARGTQTSKSDIDLLVEFGGKKSLLELVKIERELSEKAGVKVDLTTKKSMSPYIYQNIRKEMNVLYGKR